MHAQAAAGRWWSTDVVKQRPDPWSLFEVLMRMLTLEDLRASWPHETEYCRRHFSEAWQAGTRDANRLEEILKPLLRSRTPASSPHCLCCRGGGARRGGFVVQYRFSRGRHISRCRDPMINWSIGQLVAVSVSFACPRC